MSRSMRKKTIRKNKRRSYKNQKLYIEGGCPCLLNQTGGYGAASLQPIPLKTFYETNTYANDPSVTSVSSRNLPEIKGGKKGRRTKTKRNKKASKRVRFNVQHGGNLSIVEFTGTTDGAIIGRDLINGESVLEPEAYIQPALNVYAHPLA